VAQAGAHRGVVHGEAVAHRVPRQIEAGDNFTVFVQRLEGRIDVQAAQDDQRDRPEVVGEARLALEFRDLQAPAVRDEGRDRKTVARVVDRGLEQLFERQPAASSTVPPRPTPRPAPSPRSSRVPACRRALEVLGRPGRGRRQAFRPCNCCRPR
jgi:hypothetical protein